MQSSIAGGTVDKPDRGRVIRIITTRPKIMAAAFPAGPFRSALQAISLSSVLPFPASSVVLCVMIED
jgi:hypothetical protein